MIYHGTSAQPREHELIVAHLASTLVENSLQVRRVPILDTAGQDDSDDDAVNGSRFAKNDANQILGLNAWSFDGRANKGGAGEEDTPIVLTQASTKCVCERQNGEQPKSTKQGQHKQRLLSSVCAPPQTREAIQAASTHASRTPHP